MVDEYSSIDSELLISLVEQKPILWDKTMELYKNRIETQAAWEEIMVVIDSNFEEKDERTRQAFTKLVIQRWTHIRDNYHRSYKKIKDQKRTGICGKRVKPYVYSKQLSFLLKVIQLNETISNVMTEEQIHNSEGSETSEANFMQTQDDVTIRPKPKNVPKRHLKNAVSPLDTKMGKFMDSYSNNEPQTMNRHLSFFNGIVPSLDKFDDDEVIEFQMGVLQLLQDIKNSRRRITR